MGRQKNFHRRAHSRLAVDPDAAVILLHDSVHGRKSEPGSLAELLRRKEGLKNTALDLPCHSYTTVADVEHDVVSWCKFKILRCRTFVQRRIRRAHGQTAAARHGVPSVQDQV